VAVIIGGGTTIVSTQFPNGGVVSVNFNFQPSVQRLYQLGSFAVYDSFVQSVRTIQINLYGSRADGAGGSLPIDVTPSTTCIDANAVNITVNPASCVTTLTPFSEDYFLTSYSYQKENLGYGQESWSLTSKPILPSYSGNIVMLRTGFAEGTINTGPGTMDAPDMGMVIDNTSSNDSTGNPIQGETGSVQAGGIGNFDIQRNIIATQVGGSIGYIPSIDGLTGNASVSIAMTPVFL
jgi:hypothetical protein